MSVNKFLLANQVKWVQIPIPYCPHMFHHAPLPHCYCTKCIFLPPIWPPIIHICEQPSPAYQVGSNPHCPSSYVLPGPIAPLLLRQVGILASLLHANHSCLWTSFSLQIKSGGVKSPFPTVPICSAGFHCPTDYGHPERALKLLGLGRQIGLKFYEAFGIFLAKL